MGYGLRDGSVPSRVADILDLEPGGLTIDQIEAEYRIRFGDVTPGTLRRAVHRVVAMGLAYTEIEEFDDYDTDRTRQEYQAIGSKGRIGYSTVQRARVRAVA